MLRDDGALNADIVVLNLNRTVQRTVTAVIFRWLCRAALVCSKTGADFPAGSAQIAVINSSFGPLVAGLLVGLVGGSFNCVTAFMTCFALLTIIAILLGCETMGDPLPR
jgi:predicted lipid-binding transport protein (Tim44 family)